MSRRFFDKKSIHGFDEKSVRSSVMEEMAIYGHWVSESEETAKWELLLKHNEDYKESYCKKIFFEGDIHQESYSDDVQCEDINGFKKEYAVCIEEFYIDSGSEEYIYSVDVCEK